MRVDQTVSCLGYYRPLSNEMPERLLKVIQLMSERGTEFVYVGDQFDEFRVYIVQE